MNDLLFYLAIWAAFGVVTYGWVFAYSQTRYGATDDYERRVDRRFAFVFGLMGPVGLIVAILVSLNHGKPIWAYGLKWR